MIKNFTAAILNRHKKPLKVINDLNLGKINVNQVLVKIKYSGLCGSQLAEINGYREDKKFLPHLLGHEGYGKVIGVGKNVKKVKVNDNIILSWIKGKGKDTKGIKINYHNSIINAGPVTTFSQYSLISENRCFKAPAGIDPKKAVLFGCAIPTGLGMILNQLKPKINKSFVLFGAGGVGMVTLIGLKLFRPKNVLVIDKNNKRANVIKKFGKEYNFLKYTKNIKKIFNKNNHKHFDYAIDCSGVSETISLAFKLLGNKGKLIFASHPKKNSKIFLDPFDLIKGKQIIGSWGGNCKMDRDIEKFYSLEKNKKINLNLLKTKIYKLKNINIALKDFRKGKIIRAILKN